MEHLYTRTCFINQKIYTTASGIVATDFKELLTELAKKSDDHICTVLCDILPVNEILTLFKEYKIVHDYHNALFTYYPFPIDMIDINILYLCIASFENAPKQIHQISFQNNGYYFRFGVSI